MSFSDDLLVHAHTLIKNANEDNGCEEVDLRRAVSAAYYALFHQISGDAAKLLAPNVSLGTNHRIRRWFDHAEMKKVCTRFLPEALDRPLRDLIGPSASEPLRNVAKSFVRLQDARHRADYDLSFLIDEDDALDHVLRALEAIADWQSINYTAEANIFVLSLLLWKQWDKDKERA